jgi:hypothetical protein
VAGLLYGFDDSLDIEGFDGAQVDDFGFNAVFGLELFGGDERLADTAGEGYDGEVFAGALDLGFSELGGCQCLSIADIRGEGVLTGMTKSSFWASSLMGKERPYRSLCLSVTDAPADQCV